MMQNKNPFQAETATEDLKAFELAVNCFSLVCFAFEILKNTKKSIPAQQSQDYLEYIKIYILFHLKHVEEVDCLSEQAFGIIIITQSPTENNFNSQPSFTPKWINLNAEETNRTNTWHFERQGKRKLWPTFNHNLFVLPPFTFLATAPYQLYWYEKYSYL